MNDTAPVRRLVVLLTIGSFGIAALMGIIALLGGGSFGELEGQVLMTTLVVGCTSVAMLCYLAPSGTPFQVVGVVGGIVALLPAVIALMLVWSSDWDLGEAVWKIFGIGLTVALTLAQLSLLLALAGARRKLAVVLWSTVTLAGILAVIVSSLILGLDLDDDSVFRVIGIIAILDVLGTVITIAIAVFGNRDADEPGGPVRIPAELEPRLAQAAREEEKSREQVVVAALDAWLRNR